MIKKKKTLFYLALIISILWHLFLLIFFIKFAFESKKELSFVVPEELVSEPEELAQKRYDTQIIFVPNKPIKKEGEKIIPPEEGAGLEQIPLQKIPLPEISLEKVKLPPPPESTKPKKEKIIKHGEIEKKDKPKAPPLDKEILRNLALSNLLKPREPVVAAKEEEKPPKNSLLPTIPENDNRLVYQIEGLETIGESKSYGVDDKKVPWEIIQQRAKWMCYLQRLFKPIWQELNSANIFEKFRGKIPTGKSTVIFFRINKKGNFEEIQLTESCSIPEIDKIFRKTLNTTLPPIPNHLKAEIIIGELKLSFPSSYNYTANIEIYYR